MHSIKLTNFSSANVKTTFGQYQSFPLYLRPTSYESNLRDTNFTSPLPNITYLSTPTECTSPPTHIPFHPFLITAPSPNNASDHVKPNKAH
ncbi:hypothetical protein CEXT_94321 [Caerostris extrusa]|uniref:Uncharacterized protein n=1 Tax=Caerostris extrusa TaxID=172846 RepID=A0AAV4UDR1_CAEEX|nr:hypothetical protein CEXT_94321 [Caerostris extrusa]